MSFSSHRWIKKTAKTHYCWWCGKRIEAGSAAAYFAGMYEGDFNSGHSHPECKAALDSLPHDPDGYEFYSFARGRTDDDSKAPPQFSPDYRGMINNERPTPINP